MKFRCLIIDHDDTAVDSSKTIHYPAHLEVMKQLRPKHPFLSFDQWIYKNFDPGIAEFLTDELQMNPEEIEMEFKIWQEFTKTRIPSFYPGFIEILQQFRQKGGYIGVVSHSEKELIKRDYLSTNKETSFIPDSIFGWDFNPERRKPSSWPVEEILKASGVKREEALILDDLKPALVMAKSSRVKIAAAGWGHNIPAIKTTMSKECDWYLSSISDLYKLLFDD